MTPLRLDERLFRVPQTAALRRAAAHILERAVDAVDPYAATIRALARTGDNVVVGGATYTLPADARVIVVGAGKASASMARAAEDALGERIGAGLVTVPRGAGGSLSRIVLREAGHPTPDADGEAAGREMLRLVGGLSPHDLVICLLSGGGSALLTVPGDGLSLEDVAQTSDLLVKSGATITEMNTVRRHLSAIAGGRLALGARPARVVALAISDVVGSPPGAIASGPTVPDPTTYAEALAGLARYGLLDRVPKPARRLLERGRAGSVPETPKPDDPRLGSTEMTIVAENLTAARAAADAARAAGFHTLLLSTYLEGETRHVGRVLAGIARQIAATGDPAAAPACVVCGGETTVTVTGRGRGGRNQELALAAAETLEGVPDVLVVGFATDGKDGPTDAAGGVADGTSFTRARQAGLDLLRCLHEHDSYPLLDAIGDLIRTGPTGTNVADLALVLCGGGRKSFGRP